MKTDRFKNFIVLVTGIWRNSKGEILFIRRNKNNKTFKGFWQLPEGKMEFGEQPNETLTREFQEELDSRLVKARSATAISSVVAFQGNSCHLLRIVLEVKARGKITLGPEHGASQWLNFKKALSLQQVVPGTREVLLAFKSSGLK